MNNLYHDKQYTTYIARLSSKVIQQKIILRGKRMDS